MGPPVTKTRKSLIADVMSKIDEHARHAMPEGEYLQVANMLQKLHDKISSAAVMRSGVQCHTQCTTHTTHLPSVHC